MGASSDIQSVREQINGVLKSVRLRATSVPKSEACPPSSGKAGNRRFALPKNFTFTEQGITSGGIGGSSDSSTANSNDPALVKYLAQSSSKLSAFLTLDASDPNRLSARYNILDGALTLLTFAATSKSLDPSGTTTNAQVIKKANDTISFHASILKDLNSFYQKNSSRIHKSTLKSGGVQKGGTAYPIYKGLHEGTFEEKISRHYRRELTAGGQKGAVVYKAYREWLLLQQGKYNDKDTAFTVTRYLLEKDLQAQTKSGRDTQRKMLDWSGCMQDVGKLPENEVVFKGGSAYAVYTIDDASNWAYPGLTRKSYPQVYHLHTQRDQKILFTTREVTFFSRLDGDLEKSELKHSLKYVMRGDTILLETHPDKRKMSHAEASDFKSVQAAGGFVASRGRIVAIDNLSGHYRPGWKLLEQAVRKIQDRLAFVRNAMVGIHYKGASTWYFPVDVFLGLASRKFALKAMIEEAERSSWTVPGDANDDVKQQLLTGKWKDKKGEFEDFAKLVKEI